MDMVGHQAKGVSCINELTPVAAQPFEIGVLVGVVKKSLSPLIAASNDMIEQTGGNKSGTARHDCALY